MTYVITMKVLLYKVLIQINIIMFSEVIAKKYTTTGKNIRWKNIINKLWGNELTSMIRTSWKLVPK